MRKSLIVTGFEPFGGEEINPSGEAVLALPDQLDGVRIRKLILPVSFRGCFPPVAAALQAEQPAAVVCLGQAGGRFGLTPERLAINLDDARQLDNAGDQPADRPIVPDGPAAYFATLPIHQMTLAIRQAGIPASVSNSAGAYVCNHLMYCVLDMAARSCPTVTAGFLHVPWQHEQVLCRPHQPSLSGADILRGVTAGLQAVISQLER